MIDYIIKSRRDKTCWLLLFSCRSQVPIPRNLSQVELNQTVSRCRLIFTTCQADLAYFTFQTGKVTTWVLCHLWWPFMLQLGRMRVTCASGSAPASDQLRHHSPNQTNISRNLGFGQVELQLDRDLRGKPRDFFWFWNYWNTRSWISVKLEIPQLVNLFKPVKSDGFYT